MPSPAGSAPGYSGRAGAATVGETISREGEMTIRVALVTGAAQGIGQAIALRFLRDGLAVVATDVKADGLAELGRQEGAGERVHTIEQDVTDDEAPRRAVREAVERFGRLD